MTFLAAIPLIIFLLLLPSFRQKLARNSVSVKLRNGCNHFLTMLGIERTAKFEFNLLALGQLKGLGAAEGTLVEVFLNAVHALVAKGLPATSIADIGLLSDIIANGTFELLVLFVLFDIVFSLKHLHLLLRISTKV